MINVVSGNVIKRFSIARPDFGSSADVPSSLIINLLFGTIRLAKTIRCFCAPYISDALCCSTVSIPFD